MSDSEMAEEEEDEELSGSSEAEISASDEEDEEVLEPKVLPQRLTRGGKMNQVPCSGDYFKFRLSLALSHTSDSPEVIHV